MSSSRPRARSTAIALIAVLAFGAFSALPAITNEDGWLAQALHGYGYTAPNPTVSVVLPIGGSVDGGQSVTISGTGFAVGASVTFGGTPAVVIGQSGTTSITVQTPSHAAGLVSVVVTNPDTHSGTKANAYTFRIAPSIATVAPLTGAISGGTTVTLTGAGFVSGATVRFDGIAATMVTVSSSTTLTARTPAHVAGIVGVTVTNSDGQSGELSSAYTYVPGPIVTGVAPSSSFAAGGTAVVITGNNFAAGATVKFGSTAATGVNVATPTSITATSPAGTAGATTVTVTNPDGQIGTLASAFTYRAAPTVTSLLPAAGLISGGTSVTITGTGFASGASVMIGGVAATEITVVGPTSITIVTPPHAAGAVTVVVTNSDGQAGSRASGFLYQAGPTVTSMAPTSGPITGATAVTITGAGFDEDATVTIGGSALTTIVVTNSYTITGTTPAHALGTVDVIVTNPDGKAGTLTAGFTFVPPPTVVTASPATSTTNGGTTVTISGTEFRSGATVTIGGRTATATFGSSTQISIVVPPHPAGDVDIVVRNPDGQTGTLLSGFTYILAPAPSVLSLDPGLGPANGGTTVTLTGVGFSQGMTVTFGGIAAPGINVIGPTTATATTPSHAVGAVVVVITNPDGQTDSLTAGFTFTQGTTAATPADIQQANGGVTITVTHDADGNTVRFQFPGNTPLPPAGAQVWSSNSPFVWRADLAADSQAFKDRTYRDVGASESTKYLVTIYYGASQDLGFSANHQTSDISGFDALGAGTTVAAPAAGSMMAYVIVGIVLLLAVAAVVAIAVMRRRKQAETAGQDWQATPTGGATGNDPAGARGIRCPDCQTVFTVAGAAPMRLTCPSCSKHGTLIA